MLILEKDVKIVKDVYKEGNVSGDLGLYAVEGAFVKMGRNVTIEGSAVIQNNATLNLYGDGISISSNLTVNGGMAESNSEYVAGVGNVLAGFTTPSINIVNGGKAIFKNGSFNIGFVNVAVNSSFNVSTVGATPISSLETGGIWISRGSSLNLYGLKELTVTQESTGFLVGTIALWDNSVGQMTIDNDESIPAMQLSGGSYLRLAPVDGAQLTVGSLALGYGVSLTSNNGEANSNIVVTDTINADYNSFIQYGVVDASGASTVNIDFGCETKGLQGDLCD